MVTVYPKPSVCPVVVVRSSLLFTVYPELSVFSGSREVLPVSLCHRCLSSGSRDGPVWLIVSRPSVQW